MRKLSFEAYNFVRDDIEKMERKAGEVLRLEFAQSIQKSIIKVIDGLEKRKLITVLSRTSNQIEYSYNEGVEDLYYENELY
jgi:hypothetical protein